MRRSRLPRWITSMKTGVDSAVPEHSIERFVRRVTSRDGRCQASPGSTGAGRRCRRSFASQCSKGRRPMNRESRPMFRATTRTWQRCRSCAVIRSERDVTVLVNGKDLARPWLTVWQDLRTGLIWGWYLGLKPSSETARLAYADGILNFGAQPFARPADDFYSYVYTDRGKDYCSHDWAGKVISVHEQAMNPDAELECHLVERQVGVLAEFGVKRLLARGYNAKEKPVERFFKVLSEWEANTFAGYCGGHPRARP